LDLPPKELKRVFELDCWVQNVVRVEVTHPSQVTVRLEYREPVAVPRTAPDLGFLLDRRGVFLPAREIDQELLDYPLIPIENLHPPFDPEPGKFWKTGDPARGPVQKDARAVRAASLAAFLRDARQKDAQAAGLPQIVSIYSMKESGLFIRFGEDIWVYWNQAP